MLRCPWVGGELAKEIRVGEHLSEPADLLLLIDSLNKYELGIA
jgi:hypothetical protein